MTDNALSIAVPSEIRQHWYAVAACFLTSVFAWGFGFYGQSVYLSELHRLRGWSSFLIGSATTIFYLAGALLVTRVHLAIDRFGPRAVLIGGSVLLGFGAFLFCDASARWQLFGAALVMAFGWVCTTMAAISTVLALWFDQQRGLAISLALNGASAAGFLVTPVLAALSQYHGLVVAVAETALALLALLVPLVMFGMDPHFAAQNRSSVVRNAGRSASGLRTLLSGSPRPALMVGCAAICTGARRTSRVSRPSRRIVAPAARRQWCCVRGSRCRNLGDARSHRAWLCHRSARSAARQRCKLRQPGARPPRHPDVSGKAGGALRRLLPVWVVGRQCYYTAVSDHSA